MDRPPHLKDLEEDAEKQPFLPNYLLFLLASTSAAASAEFHATVREHGLRVPEWRVLACLHDEDGQMVTRLAGLALMEQSRLTRIIDQMDARGLVERRSDALDRRRVRVHLTGDGRILAEEMVQRAAEHEAALLSRLPDGKGNELRRLLKEVYRQFSGEAD
ncbi:MarR family winged helix-turn-helix transcriptional regulator [Tranquillimonas alkanivorans]|nr:MarR family transcriptional regulator [Tranquillimonas alkanivorans]